MPRRTIQGPPGMDPGEVAVLDLADYGFGHLKLPALRRKPETGLPPPPDFSLFTPAMQTEYLKMMHRKLLMAKACFEKERSLGLDSDRSGMHKEATFVALAQGPIKLCLSTQAHIQLLLEEERHLNRVFKDKNGQEDDPAVIEAATQYLLTSSHIRELLVWQTPGKTAEIRTQYVQTMMKEVFGDIVDEDE